MSFQKFKFISFCIGGRHHTSTTNIVGDITISKKFGKEIEILTLRCSNCNRKISMTVSDNVILREGLQNFFKNLLNSKKI